MKVAVLVSGGVDSSVALNLLKNKGYDVTAFYIKIWLEDELAHIGSCPWQEDLDYAQKVCDQVGVELKIISLQKEYWENVVGYTINEIKNGRTPNPDLLCNQFVKFGTFFDKISPEFEKVATGHYAKVKQEDDKFHLLMTPDEIKDQTYFLARLNQNQLSRTLFPLGDLRKDQVRKLAHELNLSTRARKDSQGICFLGKLKFKEFVQHHLGERIGDIVEVETGKVLAKHGGYWFYTLGQRQGIGLSGGPWYVVDKNPEQNIVYVSKSYFAEDKCRDSFHVTDFNWINKPESFDEIRVKLRHGPKLYDCEVDFELVYSYICRKLKFPSGR